MLYYFSDDCQPPAPLSDDPYPGSHGEGHEDEVGQPEPCLLMPRKLGGDLLLHGVRHRHGVTTGDIGGVTKKLLDILVVPAVDVSVDGVTTHVLTLVDTVVQPDAVMPLMDETERVGMSHRHLDVAGGGAATEQGEEHHHQHRIEQQEEERPRIIVIIGILSYHKFCFLSLR